MCPGSMAACEPLRSGACVWCVCGGGLRDSRSFFFPLTNKRCRLTGTCCRRACQPAHKAHGYGQQRARLTARSWGGRARRLPYSCFRAERARTPLPHIESRASHWRLLDSQRHPQLLNKSTRIENISTRTCKLKQSLSPICFASLLLLVVLTSNVH